MNIRIDKDCLLANVTIDALCEVLSEYYGAEFKRERGCYRSKGNRAICITEATSLWCNHETGEGGDYLKAVELAEGTKDFTETLQAAARRLGYSVPVNDEQAAEQRRKAAEKRREREQAEKRQAEIEQEFIRVVRETYTEHRHSLEKGLKSAECLKALEARGLSVEQVKPHFCGYNASDEAIKTPKVISEVGCDPEEHTIAKPHSFVFGSISGGVKSIGIDPDTGHKRKIEGKNGRFRADIVSTPGYTFKVYDGNGGNLYLCEGEFDALTIAAATNSTVWAIHSRDSELKAIREKAAGFEAIYLCFDRDTAGDHFTELARRGLAEFMPVDVRAALGENKDVNDKLQSLIKAGNSPEAAIKAIAKDLADAGTPPKTEQEKAAELLTNIEGYFDRTILGRYCKTVDPQCAHEHTALYCAIALASIRCANTAFCRNGAELTRLCIMHLVGAPNSGKSHALKNGLIAPLSKVVRAIDSAELPDKDELTSDSIVLHEVDDNSPEALRNSIQNAYCIAEEYTEGEGEKAKTRIIERQNKPVFVRIASEFSLAQSNRTRGEQSTFEGVTNELADGKCKASRALWRNSDKERFPTIKGVKFIECDASQFATFKDFIRKARDNSSGYCRRSFMLKCGWNVIGIDQIDTIRRKDAAKSICMTAQSCEAGARMLFPFESAPASVELRLNDDSLLSVFVTLSNALAAYRGNDERWLDSSADGIRGTAAADTAGGYATTLLEWFSCLVAATEGRSAVDESDILAAACIARRVADCEMWVDGAESISDYTGQVINEFKEMLRTKPRARELSIIESKLIKRSNAVQIWLNWAPRNVGIETFKAGTKARKAYRLLSAAEIDKRDKQVSSLDFQAPRELKDVRIICEI